MNKHIGLVHVAESAAEREPIYRLRYAVYIAEQQKQYAADHRDQLLYDGRDFDAHHLYLRDNERVVGAVRIHIGCGAPHPLLPVEDLPDCDDRVAFISRLVVEKPRRGGLVTPTLFRAAYRFGVENGVRIAATWCAPALTRLYERLGFRRYASSFHDSIVGELVPLVLIVDDVEYLNSIQSCLADVAASYFPQALCA